MLAEMKSEGMDSTRKPLLQYVQEVARTSPR